MGMEQKIVPNLWFDYNQAKKAANYYIDMFGGGRILTSAEYPEDSPGQAGTTMVVEWEAGGMRFVGINGGPMFKFTEAVSLQVTCEDQEEIDYYWSRFVGDGGEEGPCGWCKDKYGLSWQVTPRGMDELFSDPDKEKARRAFRAMEGMKKLDIAELRAAADGVTA